jgi:hypothetical protein
MRRRLLLEVRIRIDQALSILPLRSPIVISSATASQAYPAARRSNQPLELSPAQARIGWAALAVNQQNRANGLYTAGD